MDSSLRVHGLGAWSADGFRASVLQHGALGPSVSGGICACFFPPTWQGRGPHCRVVRVTVELTFELRCSKLSCKKALCQAVGHGTNVGFRGFCFRLFSGGPHALGDFGGPPLSVGPMIHLEPGQLRTECWQRLGVRYLDLDCFGATSVPKQRQCRRSSLKAALTNPDHDASLKEKKHSAMVAQRLSSRPPTAPFQVNTFEVWYSN